MFYVAVGMATVEAEPTPTAIEISVRPVPGLSQVSSSQLQLAAVT